MLGIPDASIWLAYILSVGGAILCMIYGILTWNKDNDSEKGRDEK